jgi:hypothetical protein
MGWGVGNKTATLTDASGNWWGCWQGPDSVLCVNQFGTVYSAWLTVPPGQSDADADGVADGSDNCPNTFNPSQDRTDADGDGKPDACDDYVAPDDDDEDVVSTTGPGTGTGGPIIPVTGAATTLVLELSPADLQVALEESANNTYPLEADADGQFSNACVIESITFLSEADYIPMGDFLATVIGQCSYLVNGEKQSIIMVLAMINADGQLVVPGQEETSDPAAFDIDTFLADTGFGPGAIMTSTFGASDNGVYTEDQIVNFASNGDPAGLGNILLPNSLETSGNVSD